MSSDSVPERDPQPYDDLIGRVYDVALNPERYIELRDTWEKHFISDRTRSAANMQLINPDIFSHFERAIDVLDKLDSIKPQNPTQELLAQFENVSAFILTGQQKVMAANTAARQNLGIDSGCSIKALPIFEEDRAELSRQVARMIRSGAAPVSIFRVRSNVSNRYMIVQMRRAQLESGEPIVIAATSDLRWPDGFKTLLKEAFDLSTAEAEVVRLLIECCSVKEIAQTRGRSVDTVRAQVKAIFSKTETTSQVELVRLVLSMMDMAAITLATDAKPAALDGGDGTLEALPYNAITADDGRRLEYLVLGDPKGKPILFVTSEYGCFRWPASAEREAKRRGIKIISPMRAGYGNSDLVSQRDDLCERVARDLLCVLDAEGEQSVTVVSLVDDHMYATMAEKLRPGTMNALIATAGGLPFLSEDQVDRMDKWFRFVQATARLTPNMLPYIIKMGYHLARRLGPHRFFQTIYSDSAADMKTLQEPEVLEAMLTCSEVLLAQKSKAVDTFVRQTVLEQQPWLLDHVRWLKDRMPVHFLLGLEDPAMPVESIAEHQLAFEWIDFRLYPETGQLLLFKHWRDVLDLAEDYL